MFFRFFYLFLILPLWVFSSLEDAKEYFKMGDYEKARTVLSSHDSFNENWRAQLYLIASQGFDPLERSETLISELKTHIGTVSKNPRHEDYVMAHLVHALWHLYSEGSIESDVAIIRESASPVLRERERVPPRVPTATLLAPRAEAAEGDGLLVSGPNPSYYLAINMPEGPYDAPSLGRRWEDINTSEILNDIQPNQYFPIPQLFEGTPSQEEGLKILYALRRLGHHHASYFLGAFYLGIEEQDREVLAQNKTLGLGYLMYAGHLGNTAALFQSQEILNLNSKAGWAANCMGWCFWKPYGVPRLGCGGDSLGQKFMCGLGLCGCGTSWTAEQFCISLRKVTRISLKNTAILGGMVLMFLQQLENAGLIDIFKNDDAVAGWVGLLLAGGGLGAKQFEK